GTFLVDVARHDADLRLAGRDEAGAVRPDEPTRVAAEEGLDADHVRDGGAFRDAHYERHASVGGFHDGVSGGGRRHEDEGAVRARGLHRFLHGVPDGKALVDRPALARGDSAYHLRAVLLAAEGVEGTFLAGDSLHQDLRLLVDEDAHSSCLNLTDISLRFGLFGPSALIGAPALSLTTTELSVFCGLFGLLALIGAPALSLTTAELPAVFGFFGPPALIGATTLSGTTAACPVIC